MPPYCHHHHQQLRREDEPAHGSSWLFPLFECRNLHKYVCALVFPCVPMNTVLRLLHRQYGSSDMESSAATALSVTLVDAPCLAGAMVLNKQVEQGLRSIIYGSEYDEDYDDFEMERKLSKCGAVMACAIYPLLVCPATCWLWRHAIHEANIEEELLWKTGQISMCCWPCALVQMEDELQGDTHVVKGMQRSLQGV